jgi:hypothetical protein
MARMGSEKGNYLEVRNLLPHELIARFPKLRLDNHETKSNANPRYNCVAFTKGDERHWWEPELYGGKYYWPPEINERDLLKSWVRVFTSDGYEDTNNREVEPGFEKVAIYVSLEDKLPSHVTISDGHVWKSKLGKGQDIYHATLDILEGDQESEYGVVERILKRPVRMPNQKTGV